MMMCGCARPRDGFTCVRGWWVCGTCGLPAPMYAHAMLMKYSSTMHFQNEDGETVVIKLIYFEGGPLDSRVYEIETILSPEGLGVPATSYNWTSEKKTSEKTGAVAQIWRYVDQPTSVAAPAQPTAVAPVAPAPPVVQPVDLDAASANGNASAPAASVQEDDSPAPAAVNGAAVSGAMASSAVPADDGPLPDGNALLEKRKALRLSRAQVSASSGLAQSKIGAIETGGGKRVKDSEIRQLAATLASFETANAQPVGSGASAHS